MATGDLVVVIAVFCSLLLLLSCPASGSNWSYESVSNVSFLYMNLTANTSLYNNGVAEPNQSVLNQTVLEEPDKISTIVGYSLVAIPIIILAAIGIMVVAYAAGISFDQSSIFSDAHEDRSESVHRSVGRSSGRGSDVVIVATRMRSTQNQAVIPGNAESERQAIVSHLKNQHKGDEEEEDPHQKKKSRWMNLEFK